MSDMYDKLGDLLNDVLESGKIPQEKEDQKPKTEENTVKSSGPSFFSQNTNEKIKKLRKEKHNIHSGHKTEEIPVGKVYKNTSFSTYEYKNMHKYTENLHIPKEVSESLDTLHLVSLEDWKTVKKAYHEALKNAHPDTKTEGNTYYTVEQVIKAYNTLKNYYKHK